MRAWVVSGVAIGAIGLAALALTPALSAVASGQKDATSAKVSLKILGSIGSFTPVTRDQRLAKAYAEAARESQTRGFRFTPASGALSGERSLTVIVRAPSNDEPIEVKHSQPSIGLPPVAYSIGNKSKSFDRLAVTSSAVTSRELSPIVDAIQMPQTSFALKPKRDRFSTNLQVAARDQTATAPTDEAPQTLGQEKTYMVDLSSSLSLTRRLDVQAGVRYKGPDNRLAPLITDQAKDSQAVYVGTKFKF